MTTGSRELPDAKTGIVANICSCSGDIEVTVELVSWCRVLPGDPGGSPGGPRLAGVPGSRDPDTSTTWLIYRLIDTALLRAGIA